MINTCTWAFKYILYFMPACLRLSTQNRYTLVAVKNENDRKCARPSRQNDMINYQGLYVIQRTLVSKVCHAVANYKVGNFPDAYSRYRMSRFYFLLIHSMNVSYSLIYILFKPCLIFLSAIPAPLLYRIL